MAARERISSGNVRNFGRTGISSLMTLVRLTRSNYRTQGAQDLWLRMCKLGMRRDHSLMRRGRRGLAETHFVRLQSILHLDCMDNYPVTDLQFLSGTWLGTVEKGGRVGELDFDGLF